MPDHGPNPLLTRVAILQRSADTRTTGAGATTEKDGALYSEFYNEIVFQNESAMMNSALHDFAATGSDELVNGVCDYAAIEQEQLASIDEAEKRLGQMISEFKDKQKSLMAIVKKRKAEDEA